MSELDQEIEGRRSPRKDRRYFAGMFQRAWDRMVHKGRGLLEQPRLWVLALLVGAISGYASVAFVMSIEVLSVLFFRGDETSLVDAARKLPTVALICIPTVGGLLVGALFTVTCKRVEPMTVADVIEARAVHSGRFPLWRGVVSTIAAALSLGTGASAGREGPAVVAAASISSAFASLFQISDFERRALLGCAVAAAVSTSFNAPIAGALFALEVVLGHYAVRAFAPITIAAVLGAVISRYHLGEQPAFGVEKIEFGSYVQFPALFLLGLVAASVAMAFMASVQLARDIMDAVRERLRAPMWAQTGTAGLLIGLIAAGGFPEVLGVGYQTTTAAIAGKLTFWTCVLLVAAKTVASALTLGGRFSGGVFSPALMLGAITGAAFGQVATSVFPSFSGDIAIYALAGMGAVAGSVLGAPISTTLIVFELTADYDAAIAVMVSTSVATVATQQVFRKSFFHWQLARRGVDLIADPEHEVLPGLKAGAHMRWRDSETGASDAAAWELARQGVYLHPKDDFRRAFKRFRGGKLTFLPVLDPNTSPADPGALLGALYYVDALEAYNRALVKLHEEEHS
ncbi:MAG: chloride channel protein [Neomegalonema sp.]|nr:chloride channel protein [Neomegalonema sp.]